MNTFLEIAITWGVGLTIIVLILLNIGLFR